MRPESLHHKTNITFNILFRIICMFYSKTASFEGQKSYPIGHGAEYEDYRMHICKSAGLK